jgi:hypothetical protein
VAVNKVTADKAAAEKVVADKAAVMKAAEEAMANMAADAAMMKTTGQGVVAARTIARSMGSRSGSSFGSAVGSKRASAPSGSTPPSNRSHGAWKPWYAEQLCSHQLPFILFVLYLIGFFVD